MSSVSIRHKGTASEQVSRVACSQQDYVQIQMYWKIIPFPVGSVMPVMVGWPLKSDIVLRSEEKESCTGRLRQEEYCLLGASSHTSEADTHKE